MTESDRSALRMPRQRALLDHFANHGRDLPWRRTREPWPILVAEVMLAQTQVARVMGRWEEFCRRFADPFVCARSSPAAVIEAWSGLGYNRRALNLHRCASIIVAEHGGRVPDTLAGLLELPGVGPYTARAVLVFAHGIDVGVVDTNVARVLARWHGRPLDRRDVQTLADQLVPRGRSWSWNQAMIDLGATRCVSRDPACGACPVRSWCVMGLRGFADGDPATTTAGTGSKQSRFEGSDRQGRGRLVEALRAGVVSAEPAHLAEVMGWPDDPERAVRVAGTLVDDGLIVDDEGVFRLP